MRSNFIIKAGDSDFRLNGRSRHKDRKVKTPSSAAMARGKPKRRRKPPRVRRELVRNNYLRPDPFPYKDVILWASMKGTAGKWYYNITLDQLILPFRQVYDEFKVVSLTCHYKSNNSSTAEGLFVAVLMDQKGFGAYGTASETAWFVTLGSMPGSVIRHRNSSVILKWRPTEPDSRQWRSYVRSETSYVVATVYFADNGKETVELGGVLEIKGVCQGRGRYYNAPTIHALLVQERLNLSSFETVAMHE